MLEFSNINRTEFLTYASKTHFDLVIIGGGITGAGIFLNAQNRGYNCLLLEMQDFSEGTSSRSTKLIHGGLRYLKQWNFRLVAETGKEREIVQKIAPHITYPKEIIVPSVKNGTFSKIQLKIALTIYEWLAKVPRHLKFKTYTKVQLSEEEPLLNKKGLLGGIKYYEFRTNDARLTLENIKKGVELHGTAINHIKVELIKKTSAQCFEVSCQDQLDETAFTFRGKNVINATGPWAPILSGQDKVKVSPTKGVHLVFSKSIFPLKKAVYFDTIDSRMMFAIPEGQIVYVGTTDNFYKGDLTNVHVTKEDTIYIIKNINHTFSGIEVAEEHVIASWAGVRPLIFEEGKPPSEISRKHEIYKEPNGMLTVTGGKLTGYRKMANEIVKKIPNPPKHINRQSTKNLHLSGGAFSDLDAFKTKKTSFINFAKTEGIQYEEACWIFDHFGSNSFRILEKPLKHHTHLPLYLHKALQYCIHHECVTTANDFLYRRTSLGLFRPKLAKEIKDHISETIQLHFQKETK